MKKEDIKAFMENAKDFGLEPASSVLEEWQKKVAALSMGMNAAIVQLILEGSIKPEEQVHFMLHMQDFTARIFAGEKLKLPSTGQTLDINSKAGNLFFEAGEDALVNGSKNYARIKDMVNDETRKDQAYAEPAISKPTVH